MSLLKKRGELVRVPEVLAQRWVPGHWHTATETVSTYVPDPRPSTNQGSGGDRHLSFDHGLGSDDASGLIVDY